ncbi:MAG: type VII toxin-antitoxin system MntA family adenylyltransferase antitoxin [Vicinamibacteria bacterium]
MKATPQEGHADPLSDRAQSPQGGCLSGNLDRPRAGGLTVDVSETMDPLARRVGAGRASAVVEAARRSAGLRMLLLYGSAARGEVHDLSDWDFGYLADPAFQPETLRGELSILLETDRVDLVDLARAGGQLRYRAASDGVVVFATDGEVFRRFWMEAVTFWCEAGPVLEAQYKKVLRRLDSCPPLDADLLAEKTMAVERHLARVAERLPSEASELEPSTDASDRADLVTP